MTVVALQKLARWIAMDGALGRRSFLESCAGIVAGGMTMQGSSAFAQPANAAAHFFPGFRRQTVQTSGATIMGVATLARGQRGARLGHPGC